MNCDERRAVSSLQWRHNERDGVSNHQPYDWLLNRLFRHRWKKTSKLRVTGLCEGNLPFVIWLCFDLRNQYTEFSKLNPTIVWYLKTSGFLRQGKHLSKMLLFFRHISNLTIKREITTAVVISLSTVRLHIPSRGTSSLSQKSRILTTAYLGSTWISAKCIIRITLFSFAALFERDSAKTCSTNWASGFTPVFASGSESTSGSDVLSDDISAKVTGPVWKQTFIFLQIVSGLTVLSIAMLKTYSVNDKERLG